MTNEKYLLKLANCRTADLIRRAKCENIIVDISIENIGLNINGKSDWIKDDYFQMRLNIGNLELVDAFAYLMFEGTKLENKSNRERFYKLTSWDYCLIEYTRKRSQQYSSLIRDLCNEYIIYHELGHVFNGHLKLNKLEGIDDLDRKTIEMDADSFAACRICDILKARYEKTDSLILDRAHLIWIGIVACTIVFSIQGMGNKMLTERNNHYLSPRLRLQIICKNLILVSKKMGSDVKQYANINEAELLNATSNVEDFVNKFMTVDRGFDEGHLDSKNNLSQLDEYEEFIMLREHWKNNLKDRLDKYSYIPLAK